MQTLTPVSKFKKAKSMAAAAEAVEKKQAPLALFKATVARIAVLDFVMQTSGDKKRSFLICCNILEKRVSMLRGYDPYYTQATRQYLNFRGAWFAQL